MKTWLLVIMLDNVLVDIVPTRNCDLDIRIASETHPGHDLYCVEPGYTVRPRARPEQTQGETE